VAYKQGGFKLYEAVKMVSLNHTRLIGMDKEIGSVSIGKRADIVIFDDDINIKSVIMDGKPVKL
jgi:N-acetylglucosamine-6-phosphate deacetylase